MPFPVQIIVFVFIILPSALQQAKWYKIFFLIYNQTVHKILMKMKILLFGVVKFPFSNTSHFKTKADILVCSEF